MRDMGSSFSARLSLTGSPKHHTGFKYYSTKLGYLFIPFLAIFLIPLQLQALTPINCTTTFPCPEELKPKIEFWIRAFHEFDKNHAIFHDSRSPEVVYSVIKSKTTCRASRRNGRIETERKRIRRIIQSIQSKQKLNSPRYTSDEKAILEQMNASRSFVLNKATSRIRCQTGIRDQFEKALSRYLYYKDDVLQILRENNLPEEIQYLPFVESSYNPLAYSKVGAAGLWQIMPQTARVLGLKINSAIDERLDPILATKAASRYFQNSYQSLQSLHNEREDLGYLGPFVITSYNYGIVGMKRAIKAHGTDFMHVLNNYKGRTFRTAVKNFYASFIAAKHLASQKETYFGKIEPYKFPDSNILIVPRKISATKFAKHFGVSVALLKELNPILTKRIWTGVFPIPQNFALKIPSRLSPDEISREIATLDEESIEVKVRKYRVQRGDTPCGIAYLFRVSCRELMAANNISRRRPIIRIGQTIHIPVKDQKVASKPKAPASLATPKKQKPTSGIAKAPKAPADSILVLDEKQSGSLPSPLAIDGPENLLVSATAGSKPRYYIRVESEETLGHYSDWIEGTTTQQIRRLNSIPYGKSLTIGRKIYIPLQTIDQKIEFEKKRIEYHETLEEGFEEKFDVIAFTTYNVKRGDTEWSVSKSLQVPIWLLKKHNANLRKKPMSVGDQIKVPILKEKRDEDRELIDIAPSITLPSS